MRRTKEDAAITREKILDAAMRVFSAKSYAAATLDDIARAADVTRGAIYWHFAGKAELYNALVDERFAKAFAGLAQIMAEPGTPLQTFRRLLIWQMTLIEDDPDYRAVQELTLMKTEVTPEMEEGFAKKNQRLEELVSRFSELLEKAAAAGEIRSGVEPRTAALAALGLASGLTSLWLLNPKAFSIKEQAATLVDYLLDGLRP
jgi:TetR/AcrR family acrAB operon transcriptional repressor